MEANLKLIVCCISMALFAQPLVAALPDTAYLLRAIADGDFAKVKAVLATTPASLQERDVDGNGPLHTACACADTQDDPAILWYLLDAGADAHLKNSFQETPLHHTIHLANTDKRVIYIASLVKHGTDINARDNQGYSVLDKYVIERNQQACGMLVSCFADMLGADMVPRAQELAGKEAGEGFGFTDIYEELAKKRELRFNAAGYNACTGLTRLMYAVLAGDTKKITALLKAGIAINQPSDDQWGYTALDLAVMEGKIPVVELLLANGARRDQKNKQGKTAADLASKIANSMIQKRMDALLKK